MQVVNLLLRGLLLSSESRIDSCFPCSISSLADLQSANHICRQSIQPTRFFRGLEICQPHCHFEGVHRRKRDAEYGGVHSLLCSECNFGGPSFLISGFLTASMDKKRVSSTAGIPCWARIVPGWEGGCSGDPGLSSWILAQDRCCFRAGLFKSMLRT